MFLEWALQILSQDPISPRSQNPGIPENLAKTTLFDFGQVMDSNFMAEREHKELHFRLFETNAEAVWIFDSGWTVRHPNRTSEKITGWTPVQIQGRELGDFISEEQKEAQPQGPDGRSRHKGKAQGRKASP